MIYAEISTNTNAPISFTFIAAEISGSYAENLERSPARRASFILGQHPFRTGLLTIGMPGSPQGIPEWSPTTPGQLT
jgi:hypothetical protein